jgi:hypothetical protein
MHKRYKNWQVFQGLDDAWYVVVIHQSCNFEISVVNSAASIFYTAAEAQELADRLNGESE